MFDAERMPVTIGAAIPGVGLLQGLMGLGGTTFDPVTEGGMMSAASMGATPGFATDTAFAGSPELGGRSDPSQGGSPSGGADPNDPGSQGFRRGGVIPSDRDRRLEARQATVHEGEGVLSPEAMQAIGVREFHRLNRMRPGPRLRGPGDPEFDVQFPLQEFRPRVSSNMPVVNPFDFLFPDMNELDLGRHLYQKNPRSR
jgi:hypothetical protein